MARYHPAKESTATRLDIALPEGLARFVDAQVAAGSHVDEADVIRDALRHLQTKTLDSPNFVHFNLVDAVVPMILELADVTQEDLRSMSVLNEAHRLVVSQMLELIGRIGKDVSTNAGLSHHSGPLDLSNGLGSERMYHQVRIPTFDVEVPGGVRIVTTDLWPGEITTVDQLDAIWDHARAHLEDQVSSSNEMGMIKLQSSIAARGQAMQLMANIIKAMNDSAQGVVHNLR